MSATAAVAGAAIFAVGLAVSFVGTAVRGRLVGLCAMGFGALVVLVAAQPANPASWVMAGTAGLSLTGLVVFAAALGRWTEAATGETAVLDDEPG